jgi:S-adenosylmethionine decarboxylase
MEFYGCEAELNDPQALSALLHSAAQKVGSTVLTEAKAEFQPHGVTVVLVLAESHIILATWPEHNYALLDLFLCNGSMNPEVAAATVSEALRPTDTRCSRVPHFIGARKPSDTRLLKIP